MMKNLLAILLVILVAGLVGLLAAQIDFPLSAQDHEGQPSHCSNAKAAKPPHKCDCKKTGGMGCEVEDVKCKVYCRKNHCHCFHPACDS